MSILPTRSDPSSPQDDREYLSEDSAFQTEYPAIYEYLSRVSVDGHNRSPSRLVVYYEENQAVLLLTDPYTAKILFHASDSVEEALGTLNVRLANPPVRGWKNDRRARR